MQNSHVEETPKKAPKKTVAENDEKTEEGVGEDVSKKQDNGKKDINESVEEITSISKGTEEVVRPIDCGTKKELVLESV